jgi:uncharacterized protein involved in exopolysaccharide biosynthesis
VKGKDEATEISAASASLFDGRDGEKVRRYVSFVVGSARRHRLLAVAVFVSIMGGVIGSIFAFPKTYHVEAKALAQRSSALTVRGDEPGGDSLTRVAAETVLRRDNLLTLIQQTDLLRYTREHRAPVQRARDAVAAALHVREDSEADRLDGLVELLEKKLAVWTSENGSTVTIAIDWSDGPMACRLVDAAQRVFLDARYAREIIALAESIEILRGHTTGLKADIDDAVGAIEKMRGVGDVPKGGAVSPIPSPQPRSVSWQRSVAPRVPAANAEPNPELGRMKIEIEAKQHTIDELEEFRRHRLSELQARLAEARTTYTENHPAIGDLKLSMSALSDESPQVTRLRQEVASLQAEYDRRSASDAPVPGVASTPMFASLAASRTATPPQLSTDVLRLDLDLREDRDPGMVSARGQLRDAMDKYAALRTRIQTAQIDLETAQAAFKYRYSVVSPAHLPKSPTKPNVPLVILAALIAAVFCALLFAVLVDVRRGRLLERWQIEQLLDRPVLGEVSLPMLEGPDFE